MGFPRRFVTGRELDRVKARERADDGRQCDIGRRRVGDRLDCGRRIPRRHHLRADAADPGC